MRYSTHFSVNGPTPQSEPLQGRESEQVKNSAGGYTFALDKWDQLDRFLILGSEGNTYYASEQKMTRDNAKNVIECIKEDGVRVVDTLLEISEEGRAPKNEPALFVLALCASVGDLRTRQYALRSLSRVARIGTHLFHFAEYVQSNRGWGRALRRAVGDWYNNKDADDLAYQVAKYQQRDGWSNRDLLRLSHPKPLTFGQSAVYDWVCGREGTFRQVVPSILKAFDVLKDDPSPKTAVHLIKTYKLPRECIPTELLNNADVWRALLVDMKPTALIRNLGKLSNIGVLKPLSNDLGLVLEKLMDHASLVQARVHPIQILIALKMYSQGRGEKGNLTWNVVPQVVDALNDAFYATFKSVEPTNKRILLALDVSGSMGSGGIAGSSLTPLEGEAALALVTANTEKNYHILGFSHELVPLDITARSSIADACKTISRTPMGGTDCSQPMLHALKNNLAVDAFVVYTDNETWAGRIHPVQALKQYREKTGIPAKLVVVGMIANKFSIADPSDAGMMDVVGFDTATPQIISDFIRG